VWPPNVLHFESNKYDENRHTVSRHRVGNLSAPRYQLAQQRGAPSPASRTPPAHFNNWSLDPLTLTVLTGHQSQYWPCSPRQRLATCPQPPRPRGQPLFDEAPSVIHSSRSARSGHQSVIWLQIPSMTSSRYLQEGLEYSSPPRGSDPRSHPSGPSFESKHHDSPTARSLLSRSQPTLCQYQSNKRYISTTVAVRTYRSQATTKRFNASGAISCDTRCAHSSYIKLLIEPVNTHLDTAQSSHQTQISLPQQFVNLVARRPTSKIQRLP